MAFRYSIKGDEVLDLISRITTFKVLRARQHSINIPPVEKIPPPLADDLAVVAGETLITKTLTVATSYLLGNTSKSSKDWTETRLEHKVMDPSLWTVRARCGDRVHLSSLRTTLCPLILSFSVVATHSFAMTGFHFEPTHSSPK